ncbi:MAG: MBL fold metallo-hydrolase [Thermodesulfobacteriota bacterium]|nr:MBL fold metallo-hydrolase [Thermodesulfobacteriota bacterium]
MTQEIMSISESVYLFDTKAFGMSSFTSVYLVIGKEKVLIETGPTTSSLQVLNGLKKLAIDPKEITHLILTHIHLDHGGGAGTLLQVMPNAKVIVHENGMRHLVDPSKLVNSSRRVFGDLIDKWYGKVVPIEENRILPVKGGEILDIGDGHRLEMINSPGHSFHHICIYLEKIKGLFTGDAAGVFFHESEALIPTTPPPEFDPKINIETIKGFINKDIDSLLFSHFGEAKNVENTLNKSIKYLIKWDKLVFSMMDAGKSTQDIIERLRQDAKKELGSIEKRGPVYKWTMDYHIPMCAHGYLHYLKKRNSLVL